MVSQITSRRALKIYLLQGKARQCRAFPCNRTKMAIRRREGETHECQKAYRLQCHVRRIG